jgi:hypothetical protein
MKRNRFLRVLSKFVGLVALYYPVATFGQTSPQPALGYAQVANGQFSSNLFYVTSLNVFNPNDSMIQVNVYDSDAENPGSDMGLGFSTNCNVDAGNGAVTVPAHSTCLLVSDGGGSGNPNPGIKVGWLMVYETTGSYDIGGYLAYTLNQGSYTNATPIFIAGVSPTPVSPQFAISIYCDAPSAQDVGLALANVFSDGPVTMQAQLVNSEGSIVDQNTITIPSLGHISIFVSQIFPDTLANAQAFVGTVLMSAVNAGDAVIAAALIQQGSLYGGAPPTIVAVQNSNSAAATAKAYRGSAFSRLAMARIRTIDKLSSPISGSK